MTDVDLLPTRRSTDHLRALADEGAAIFGEEPDPTELLEWFGSALGIDRIAVAVSFSDGVMAHLAGHALPGVDLLFVDTGYHFAETLGLREAVAATLPVNVRSLTPEQTHAELDEQFGENLWERDPDLCCAIRKTAPMAAALRGYDAWATGLRRSDHDGRAQTPVVHWDDTNGLIKINPIAAFTDGDLETHIQEHSIMENPLKQIGYRSIGCAPCTRAVEAGEDERAGRWAGRAKTECGLHL
ncbi:MAG: phosphoadenylyl-sulfate reductase [Candidatus Nanopelagicales bacterium]|nr:phosphoadenylyl-sulfate reductase [Candidatus Nanopelagicales bacterium]MDZ4249513.1 phosphoadenylyl-sulfate reductase [Candidatus Nanopelagicales bacterium]